MYLDNIKCHGCMNTISSKLDALGFPNHEINVEEGKINIDHDHEDDLDKIAKALKNLGYPKKGTSKFTDSAKSYVSCAIGKIKSS